MRISPGKDCETAAESDLQNENEKPGAWKPEKDFGIGAESDLQIENEDENEKTGIGRRSRRLREHLADSYRRKETRRADAGGEGLRGYLVGLAEGRRVDAGGVSVERDCGPALGCR